LTARPGRSTTRIVRTRVLVFGASGYSGLELLRWLARHPRAEVAGASSERWAGRPVGGPIAGWPGGLHFEPHPALLERAVEGAIAFLATPAETSLSLAPALLSRGARVIDLSGAFRLRRAEAYPEWYGFEHPAPALLDQAAYGLPELFPEPGAPGAPAAPAAGGRLVANPGCYATAAILAIAPLLSAKLVDPAAPIVLDGKSGATGAGKKLEESMLFSEVAEAIRPYRVGKHQHTPEIEQALGLALGRPVALTFTAHLVPLRRGLVVSAYLRARAGLAGRGSGAPEIAEAYRAAYAGARFVRVRSEPPDPAGVAGTNICDVHAVLDPRTETLIAFGALDNLVKGAAGQAIQNMNRLLGLDPSTGLVAP
jgi:N-acetyl-gamma-glutamyl-phosphate reductase